MNDNVQSFNHQVKDLEKRIERPRIEGKNRSEIDRLNGELMAVRLQMQAEIHSLNLQLSERYRNNS